MDPSRGVAISLRGLRKEFGHGSAAVTAVDGVTLDVLDGEFLTLLGPSGSGKTTVLRMIAGFVYLSQRLSSDAAGGGRI